MHCPGLSSSMSVGALTRGRVAGHCSVTTASRIAKEWSTTAAVVSFLTTLHFCDNRKVGFDARETTQTVNRARERKLMRPSNARIGRISRKIAGDARSPAAEQLAEEAADEVHQIVRRRSGRGGGLCRCCPHGCRRSLCFRSLLGARRLRGSGAGGLGVGRSGGRREIGRARVGNQS